MLLVKYGEEERNMVIAHFFEKIYNVIMVENHIHKFIGWNDIENQLNHLCKLHNYDITFKYRNEQWEITGNDTVIVYDLPELFYHFKRYYRFQR